MNLTLQPENMSCADFLPSKREGEKKTKKSLKQTKSTKFFKSIWNSDPTFLLTVNRWQISEDWRVSGHSLVCPQR